MSETVLIIGVRRKCYKAALKLGHKVVVWSNGPLDDSRKKKLAGWLEIPFETCEKGLTPEVIDFLKTHKVTRVLASTEESVVLGARARALLEIKPLGVGIAERFHNKLVMKNSAREAGIPMTPYEFVKEDTEPGFLLERLGLPMVFKPVDKSGAQDVQIARSEAEVAALMRPGLLAEAFVQGSEASVETFVKDGEPVFHNCTEYLHQWKKSVVPAQLDEHLKNQIFEMNDLVIRHFGLDRGMTHAEFYLTENGPLFGEIAARPPGGYYMELIERVYGFDPWKAYVQLSCEQNPEEIKQSPGGHGAVMLLHPGAGTLKTIKGEQAVREFLSEIIDFKIRVQPGDRIESHTKTSNEVGHLLFYEKTREKLMKAIEFVENNLRFELD